jgi:hypothetical protein
MAEVLKFWKKLSLVFVAILFLLMVVISLLIFSKNPHFSKSGLQTLDSIVGMRYVWQVVGEIQKTESSTTLSAVQIKSNEVMRLVRLLENGGDFLRLVGIQAIEIDPKVFERYRLDYVGDCFKLKVCAYDPICNLTILADVEVKLEYENDQLMLDIKQLKLGRISLPAAVVDKLEDNLRNKIENHHYYQLFQKIISKISVDQAGNITIWYSPYELKCIIKSSGLAFGKK